VLHQAFHIQRGDDVQTPPKNAIFQSFNLQSKWGALEVIVLADGTNPQPGRNRLTQLAVQKTLAELRERTKTARSIETALRETFDAVHQELRTQRLNSEEPEQQTCDLAVSVINGDSFFIAITGSLSAVLVKAGVVEMAAGSKTRTASFGVQPDFEPEIRGPIALAKGDDLVVGGDTMLGSSTSTWKNVRKEELLETLKNEKDLKRAAKRLVSYPLGRNIEEDVSVIIIRNPKKEKAQTSPVMFLVLLGLGGLILLAYLLMSKPKNPELDLHERSSGPDYTIVQIEKGDTAKTYTVSTGKDWLELQINNVRLNTGPENSIHIEDGERFLADIGNLGSWVLLQHVDPQKLFTLKSEELRFDLEPFSPGSIGIRLDDEHIVFYCFSGKCTLLASGQTQPIEAGNKVIVTVDGPEPAVQITETGISEFEHDCDCSIR
jgi:serine/threonine protein phosphatase PrpC